MKFLHCADLHIGRRLMQVSLIEDQKYILRQILDIAKRHHVDALIIAGDVYDKNSPSEEAFSLWDWFLVELASHQLETIVISGNHDSNDRLGVGKRLLERTNIHVITHLTTTINPITIANVDFYPIPFIKPVYVANVYEDFKSSNYQEAYQFVLDRLKPKKDRKNVMIGHQFFVSGSSEPELAQSETGLTLGGLDAINTTILEAFDYVALGHIHRPQRIGSDTIRYAGSILKYAFEEAQQRKSVTLVTVDDTVVYDQIPLKPLRDVRVIKGPIDELIKIGDAETSQDYIHAIITDETVVHNAITRLQRVYPNTLTLEVQNQLSTHNGSLQRAEEVVSKKPLELVHDFFEQQTGRDLNDEEQRLVVSILDEIGDAS